MAVDEILTRSLVTAPVFAPTKRPITELALVFLLGANSSTSDWGSRGVGSEDGGGGRWWHVCDGLMVLVVVGGEGLSGGAVCYAVTSSSLEAATRDQLLMVLLRRGGASSWEVGIPLAAERNVGLSSQDSSTFHPENTKVKYRH